MLIGIRGAGDLATGVAVRLKKCGFSLFMLDIKQPTTVRRTVAFSQAIYDKTITIETVTAIHADSYQEAESILNDGNIPILVDEQAESFAYFKPTIVVDAIIAKKNLGTHINQADYVIALGPGFTASVDCHCVIETNRGHHLGRCIYEGSAEPNTGIPSTILSHSADRVIRAVCAGIVKPCVSIGDIVKKNDVVAVVEGVEIKAKIDGMIRGMLQPNTYATEHMKIGDIDPRGDLAFYTTVSDKARAIGGGVLEAILVNNFSKSRCNCYGSTDTRNESQEM